MNLNDNLKFVGQFSIKTFKKDGTVEEYTDKNLIMDEARTNMAQLIGGVNTGVDLVGQPINKFVIGTKGHVGINILDYKKVGENGFDSTRVKLFSEEIVDGGYNYSVPFDPAGNTDITVSSTGTLFTGETNLGDDATLNTVRRVVSDRTVSYTITIPAECANTGLVDEPVIAYTEAALYASGEIFSMKTFPARVKEDTVKFEITWSIIF